MDHITKAILEEAMENIEKYLDDPSIYNEPYDIQVIDFLNTLWSTKIAKWELLIKGLAKEMFGIS